jgi:hypothetical protein
LDPLRRCYHFPHVAPAWRVASDFEARFATLDSDVAVAYEDKPGAAAASVDSLLAVVAAGLDACSYSLGPHRETGNSEVLAPRVQPSSLRRM